MSMENYDKIAADIWTMSPPCQPYSRLGLQKGSQDNRSKSFLHLLEVLETMCHRPKYILVENVKGFEESDSRDLLVDSLNRCDYTFQEFLLTPLQLGIPNSRMRYYLLVREDESSQHNIYRYKDGYSFSFLFSVLNDRCVWKICLLSYIGQTETIIIYTTTYKYDYCIYSRIKTYVYRV